MSQTTTTGPEPAHVPATDGTTFAVHRGSDLLTIKAGAEQTAGALTAVAITTEPGGGPAPHTHPQSEVFYVLDGEVEFALERDGELAHVVARAGDVVVIPGGRGHGYTNHAEGRARLLSVSHPSGMEDFFADLGHPLGADGSVPAAASEPPDPAVFPRHGVRGFPPAS